jgi:hypothetical protein
MLWRRRQSDASGRSAAAARCRHGSIFVVDAASAATTSRRFLAFLFY